VRDWTLLLARLGIAACFLPSAIAHVSNLSGLALSLWMKGMPFSHGVATACAIAELFGALALALGLAPRLTVTALASSLVITTGTLHRFWDVPGAARALEQAIFLGNAAMLAALAFYVVSGPGAWSWQAFWKALPAPAAPQTTPKKQPRPRKPRAKAAPAANPPDLAQAA
jgi:putative oxidoreductase